MGAVTGASTTWVTSFTRSTLLRNRDLDESAGELAYVLEPVMTGAPFTQSLRRTSGMRSAVLLHRLPLGASISGAVIELIACAYLR